MLHVDISKLYVNVIMLHVDIYNLSFLTVSTFTGKAQSICAIYVLSRVQKGEEGL